MRLTEESKLNIVYQDLDQLHSNPHNARTHSKHQIRQLAESMRQCGWTTPILVDANNTIIAGHGRKAAAKLLGIAEVPTIRLDGLTKEQIRAYVIADNKLAENAGWDREILAIEFQELLALDCLDITVTGFEIPEIDLILEEANRAPEEEAPPEPDFDQEPVTQLGDLWLLGKHRIICGNSLHQATYRELMGSRRAAMVSDREQSAEEISDQIPGSEPWDVLHCCRRLCVRGKAIEGYWHARGRFRRS